MTFIKRAASLCGLFSIFDKNLQVKKEKIWFIVQELVVAIFAIYFISVYITACKKENLIVPQKKETPRITPVMGNGAISRPLVN